MKENKSYDNEYEVSPNGSRAALGQTALNGAYSTDKTVVAPILYKRIRMKNYLEMSDEERNELRKLQNKFIELVEKKGAVDSDTVIDCFPKITVEDLKKVIYPQYEDIFREYIDNY